MPLLSKYCYTYNFHIKNNHISLITLKKFIELLHSTYYYIILTQKKSFLITIRFNQSTLSLTHNPSSFSAFLRHNRNISPRFLRILKQTLTVDLLPQPHLFQAQRFTTPYWVITHPFYVQNSIIHNLFLYLIHLH